MIKYDKYKPSEIDWLGNIPADWEVKRVKDVSSIISKGTTPSTEGESYTDFGVKFIKAENINENGYVSEFPSFFISDKTNDLLNRSKLKSNDLLLVIAGATTGKIAVIKEEQLPANTNQAVCFIRLKSTEKSTFKFKYYFINSSYFQDLVWLYAVTSAQPNLPMAVLSRFSIFYPSLKAQIKIADYLDTKVEAIDKKINQLLQKTNYYKEYRKCLINEAVCKGLDKNIKFVDSGVDWLNKIPIGWQVKRVKDCYNIFTGNSISDKGLHEDKNNSIDYVATKDIDIETGNIDYDNGVYIQLTDKSFKIAKANSTLICIEGASAGKKIGFTHKDVCFVNKLCAIKSLNGQNFDKYFFYFTQSVLFEKQFFSILNGLIGGVSLSSIKYFDIILPKIDEQKIIANYLDDKTQTIDKIVSNINTQIQTLKELRKTLINDAVTGKIKITKD